MNIYLLSMAPGLDLTPWERERFTSFFFYTPANHPYLHSFPTRRSSDLAPGPAGGPSDAFADLSQPGPNRGGINHYFFSWATSALACAAFGPSGASLV